MSTELNLIAIKSDFERRSSDELINILKYTADDWKPPVISLIQEILMDRGVRQDEINSYAIAFETLRENLNNQSGMYRAAGFWVRVGQYVIDHTILLGICYIIQFYLAGEGLLDQSGRYEAYCMGVYLIYYAVTIEFANATPGMLIVGLKILDNRKEKITPGTGIARGVMMIVNFLTLSLGHLWLLVDKQQRTLVDIVTKSCVVYNQ